MNVRALEVPPKTWTRSSQVVDLCQRKVLESGSGRVGEKEGEVLNDEVVIAHPPSWQASR
jgi:hypothetical protein